VERERKGKKGQFKHLIEVTIAALPGTSQRGGKEKKGGEREKGQFKHERKEKRQYRGQDLSLTTRERGGDEGDTKGGGRGEKGQMLRQGGGGKKKRVWVGSQERKRALMSCFS